jgi:ubiquinone biosynthesis protein UbiJ
LNTPPFSVLNAALLNHLLNQQPWTRDQLCQYAGKIICLRIPPVSLTLLIESSGEFAAVSNSEENAPDATLTLPAAAAMRFALTRKLDMAELNIQGNFEIASTVGRVLQRLKWDAEEDLSRIVGDIPAHKIMQFGRNALAEAQRQATSLAGMFAEFWQEEDPLIAKRRHLEQFACAVDDLRNDTERLSKRLEKLNNTH